MQKVSNINQPFISKETYNYYKPEDFVNFGVFRVKQIHNLPKYLCEKRENINLKIMYTLGHLKCTKELSWKLPINRTFINFLMDLYTIPMIHENDDEFKRVFTEGQIDSIAQKHYPDEQFKKYQSYRPLIFKTLLIPIEQTKLKNFSFMKDNLFALKNISNTLHANRMDKFKNLSAISSNIFTNRILGDSFETYCMWVAYILFKTQQFDSMVFTNKSIEEMFGVNSYDLNKAIKTINDITDTTIVKQSVYKYVSYIEARNIDADILLKKAHSKANKLTVGFEFSNVIDTVQQLESMLPTIFNIKNECSLLELRETLLKTNIFVEYSTPSTQEEVVFGKNFTSLKDGKLKSLGFVLARAFERCQDVQMVRDVKFRFGKGHYTTLKKVYNFKERNLTRSTALQYTNTVTLGNYEKHYLNEVSLHY